MKNNLTLLSVILAAGTAGVVGFNVANSSFVAALPGDVILGAAASVAILAFAIYDYSRHYAPLALPGRLLRPKLPAAATPRSLGNDCCKDRAA